jgi:NAD(P)-dependent dehydrogenase (short-subunit alcohol dehydrogenase family)
MDLDLKGKRVLVTGGSRGIGRACAEAFAAERAEVKIAFRNAPGETSFAWRRRGHGAALLKA